MEGESVEEYRDIIDLSRPISDRHPHMPTKERAAMFAPFAALGRFDPCGQMAAEMAEEIETEHIDGETDG